eukprot:6186356-Pleurochrysis_carterae.AAC.1
MAALSREAPSRATGRWITQSGDQARRAVIKARRVVIKPLGVVGSHAGLCYMTQTKCTGIKYPDAQQATAGGAAASSRCAEHGEKSLRGMWAWRRLDDDEDAGDGEDERVGPVSYTHLRAHETDSYL